MLATTQKFGSFEMIVDWRLPAGGKDVDGGSNGIHMGIAMVPFAGHKEAKARGQWNRFHVTVRGKQYQVRLNDKLVIENEAAAPYGGAIGLKHDGAPIQFANIYVRELK